MKNISILNYNIKSKKYFSTVINQIKSKDEIVNRIHKYNMNTITMVFIFYIGIPGSVWKIYRKKI